MDLPWSTALLSLEARAFGLDTSDRYLPEHHLCELWPCPKPWGRVEEGGRASSSWTLSSPRAGGVMTLLLSALLFLLGEALHTACLTTLPAVLLGGREVGGGICLPVCGSRISRYRYVHGFIWEQGACLGGEGFYWVWIYHPLSVMGVIVSLRMCVNRSVFVWLCVSEFALVTRAFILASQPLENVCVLSFPLYLLRAMCAFVCIYTGSSVTKWLGAQAA